VQPRPPSRPASALPALTGARFFAAGSVVAFHYGRDSLRAIAPWLGRSAALGPAAVSFFYVLSGAVLTWGCTGPDGLPARPARVFWVQRAARILPAYLLALAISAVPFAAGVWKHHPGEGGIARIVSGLAAGLLLLQAFWPPVAAGLNTPAWSISCEAFFYAAWPRLAGRLRAAGPRFPWRKGLLLWAAGLVAPTLAILAVRAGVLPRGPFPSLLDDVSGAELLVRAVSYFPPLRLPEFALGIVLGHSLRQTPERARSVPGDTARELALLGVLLAFGWALGTEPTSSRTDSALVRRIVIESGSLAPLFALLVWQLARGRGLAARCLSLRGMLVLGEASYALYIFQEPVFVLLTGALKRVAPSVLAWQDATFWGYAALLVLVSLAVHAHVELPLRAYLTARLRPRARVPTLARSDAPRASEELR
jgi:peptidoglycan/LPS O-acetylase OafA/YrhL